MNEKIQIRVLFFAHLKDAAGKNCGEIAVPAGTTVSGLREEMISHCPALDPPLRRAIASVNRQFAAENDLLNDGDEVAFFPPVSGGTELPTVVAITREPFCLDELLEQVTLTTTGAAAIFTGMIRGKTMRGEPHETLSLEYEAYVPMAEEKLRQIAVEIRSRWQTVEGIALVQRIGKLQAKTPTVAVICTAAHRDTGVFDAARYGIDRLKEIVPVWKKEIGPNGEEWVEGEYTPKPGE